MKKITCLLILVFTLVQSVQAGVTSFDINAQHSSNDIYKYAKNLVAQYPNLLVFEELGTSVDGRLIYCVKFTQDIENIDKTYVSKMHHLIEAGIHSRENMGANAVIKMIEDYCIDVYNDQHIPEINVKKMIEDHAFHFIPLSNPDGYDLSLYGIGKMRKLSTVDYLLHMEDQEFSNYKANVRGVDINRNFPGLYYNVASDQWEDVWNLQHNEFRSYEPSGAYYFGESSASEPETNILMDYALKYDFRDYISFHSKGQVVFWDHWMLPDDFRKVTSEYASLAAYYTGYRKMPVDNKQSTSSGYFTDYTAMNTLKPSITIELLDYSVQLPANTRLFADEYQHIKTIVLRVAEKSEHVGYYPFRLYKDGYYVRDFLNEEYALAMAEKIGGYILEGDGTPLLWYYEETILELRNFHILDLDMRL